MFLYRFQPVLKVYLKETTGIREELVIIVEKKIKDNFCAVDDGYSSVLNRPRSHKL